MFVSNQVHLPGIVFVAAVAVVIACWAEVADAIGWTKMYIPYNDMDEDEFGDYGPYKKNDPLRQHLHLYQTPSDQPTPVYLFSHSDGATPNLSEGQMKKIASTGYSIISWESSTSVPTSLMRNCWKDFEMVWSWMKKNAASYNLDRRSVIVGGRSRGTLCSWPMAHSQKPEIKGIYMYNVLPDTAWDNKAKTGSSYIWEDVVTANSPPAHLLFGPECPKPIQQNCKPSPKKKHNPKNGQKIVDLYNELGIGSRIQLTDGLTNNDIGVHEFFPEFVASLSSYEGSSTSTSSHSSTSTSTSGSFDSPNSSHSSGSSSAGMDSSSTSWLGSGEEVDAAESASGSSSNSYSTASGEEGEGSSLTSSLSFLSDMSEEDKRFFLMIGIGCAVCVLLIYINCGLSEELEEEDKKRKVSVGDGEGEKLIMDSNPDEAHHQTKTAKKFASRSKMPKGKSKIKRKG